MSIGRISEFNIHKDDWSLYIDRLDQYFVVNNIEAVNQVPTLITVMGAESYELLVNLCTPDKPKSKTYAQLTDVMKKHLQPKPSPLAERYKFRNRKQKEGESIADYVAVLKKMSISCEFGTGLQEGLRDQLACGISSEAVRQRLFAEESLDFGKAYNLAVNMEAAERDAAMVEGRSLSERSGPVAQCQVLAAGKERRGTGGAQGRNAGAGGTSGHARKYHADGNGHRDDSALSRCNICGRQHDSSKCKFASYICRVCNRRGHLRKMCPNLVDQHQVHVTHRTEDRSESESDSGGSMEVMLADLNKLSVEHCKPILIPVKVEGKNISMECDTGSAVSCISFKMYEKLYKHLELKPCQLTLRYYTGEIVSPLGVIEPEVEYNGCKKRLDLYVVKGGKSLLLGRQWITELRIQLVINDNCHSVSMDEEFNYAEFSSRYYKVFEDGLGCFTGGPVSISLREGARPVFLRARPLAYALRAPVERALEELVRDGILTPVERSDWATPIVPVVKKDGNIRICADFKITLNKVIEVDRYPLPRVEDILVRLEGGERFSKLDLSQAYAQFLLDDTKKCAVINTHKGLFMYNRLVYGLSSSPGIFQRRLEQLFSDLPYVGVFLDDIIITGRNTEEHLSNLHKVFERLQSYGLKVKKEKCEFFSKSIQYLGHIVTKEGVQTCPDKVKAILKTPVPQNVSELRAFIGMIMYYGKFIKNVSTILAPLYDLLKAGVKFFWSMECERAYTQVKRALVSSEVLAHYSSELPLVLTTDASSVGVGAVLSHLTPDGERPIAFASRSLTPAERAYSQIDREALSIVYGIKKYHQYLYGRKFTMRTDHKPLTYIFGDKVGIPVMAASRLQRWAVLLSGYVYDIEYIPSAKNCADALSRLPYRDSKGTAAQEVTYVNFVEQFLPVTNREVSKATSSDTTLSRVLMYIQSGWPTICPNDEIKPYFLKKNELYSESGCVMWGYRMAIPSSLRKAILKQLHSSHMGIVKTKSLARSYVWWPRIDDEVEEVCRGCETCAAEADAPPRAPIRPWPYTLTPWSRIHLDFLGPLKGKTFLVVIDATTKWLELFEMNRTNASSVIKALRTIFARFGLPVEVVSDQGPPFTSVED